MNSEIENNLILLRNMITTRSLLLEKIIEMDKDVEEHNLILQKTEPGRKALRVIGNVVVERTSEEILKSVQEDLEQMKKVITNLTSELKKKEEEIEKFIQKNKLENYVTGMKV